jgi:uncharacterized membrane protein YbhN (UPF0104 family)/tRNA A-37 threonylcarbamoyl transferase component Bud32
MPTGGSNTRSGREFGAAIEGFDVTGSGQHEDATRGYTRSPQDVLRGVVFAAISATLLGLTIGLEDAVVGVEQDIVKLFGFVSPSVERVLHGGVELVAVLITVGVYLVPLITRRTRLFGYIILAAVMSMILMSGAQWVVDREASLIIVNNLADRAGITGGTASGSIGLAQMSGMFVVLAPFVTRRWRWAGALTIAVFLLARVLVAPEFPADVFLALPIGAMCGSIILFVLGRPDRRPTITAIRAALVSAGLPTSEVHVATVDARGSTPYFGTLVDGTGVFVKVLGSEERAADLLFRAYRFLRFKNIGDDRPFSSLRRTIEHEALVALIARDVGVRTPRLRGVVDVGGDSMLLAYEMIGGGSLDGVPDEVVTDELMRKTWEQIAVLRKHRIAHRDLRRANVFVEGDGTPWMIDFGFSEVAVDQSILDADVAQMMSSLAVVVGAERAVRAAVDALGADDVGEALPRLQSKALSGATQTALKEHPGLLEQLQTQVIEQCGVDDVAFVPLERISRHTTITVIALALATYFLFPQFADLPGIVGQVTSANWAWMPLIILASAGTYLAASMSLAGAIPQRLPAGPLVAASLGSSFTGTLAPAGMGGLALNIRFLQKQGVDRTVAVTGAGLNTIAGFVGHIVLIGVFLIWAGRDAFGSFTLPDPKWFLIALGAIVAVGALGLTIPTTRRMSIDKLLPILTSSFTALSDLLRRPGKIALLLGGSTLVTLFYLTTLFLSIEAFGGGLPFATAGAVFLVGSAIAQAAPTPGGLGAVEAALIAGLVSAGLDHTVAVPAVFLYRLSTFWLPTLPGWIAFQWLERHEYL